MPCDMTCYGTWSEETKIWNNTLLLVSWKLWKFCKNWILFRSHFFISPAVPSLDFIITSEVDAFKTFITRKPFLAAKSFISLPLSKVSLVLFLIHVHFAILILHLLFIPIYFLQNLMRLIWEKEVYLWHSGRHPPFKL